MGEAIIRRREGEVVANLLRVVVQRSEALVGARQKSVALSGLR
jgi:hypothetical protein